MENTELQKIWRSIDNEIDYKSKDELNLLLKSKAKQTLNKFLVITISSMVTSIGLFIFLVITSINRQNDIIYLMNNALLGFITLTSLVYGFISWHKIQNNKFNLSLTDWLNGRINLLSKGLTGKFNKLCLFIIPLIYILIELSIHVYFENKPFIEVLQTEESVFGLLAGASVGLFVSYFSVGKIRKYQLKNLRFLKDLYTRLNQC